MEDNELYSADELVELIARESVIKGFKTLGIEGTEQAILRGYTAMPKLQERLLTEYNKILEEYRRK